jgi:hypothetical protein
VLMFPSTLHNMNWPLYGLSWLSVQGRTCAVYEKHTLKQVLM